MGFDINVTMTLHMCPETGKPCYYGKKFEKVYELPNIVVPETMRKYLEGRGHHFHAYTDHFNENDLYNVDVSVFLEQYPDWDDVQACPVWSDDCGWTEEDHEGFKRLLEWCAKQGVDFRVCWSY